MAAPFVNGEQRERITARLKTRLHTDEKAQVECRLRFYGQEGGEPLFSANGFADAVKGDTVYELKFVSELRHEHFLQCAVYMAALELPKGILWNTRDNTAYEIEIPDRASFLDAVTRTVTKEMIKKYSLLVYPDTGRQINEPVRALYVYGGRVQSFQLFQLQL